MTDTPKTAAELEAEIAADEAALAAAISAEHAAKALDQASADAAAAQAADAAAPPEVAFTHRCSRGHLCGCLFGASESTGGVGTGGHACGWAADMEETGTVGARLAARQQNEARLAELKAEQAALEADLAATA